MEEAYPKYQERRISVPQEFEKVFSHFYFAENTSEQPVKKILLPTYQTIILFCFGKEASLTTKKGTVITTDQCMIFGPIRQSFTYTLPAGTAILVANLKDDAFYRFFGKTYIEKNSAVNPDNLLGENCFSLLCQELAGIGSPENQVSHILEFSRPYLKKQDETSLLLKNFKDENLHPVKTIAEQTNTTERSIQIKQKEYFGYSSKELSRYNRFLKAIKIIEKEIENQNKVEWFSIISECNYYDQSQLIHDFKHFLNVSPSKYLKFQQDICNPKSR